MAGRHGGTHLSFPLVQAHRLKLVPCVPSNSDHSVESAPVFCGLAVRTGFGATLPHPPCPSPRHPARAESATFLASRCSHPPSHTPATPSTISTMQLTPAQYACFRFLPAFHPCSTPCRSVSRCLLGYPLWAIETAHASLLERLGSRLIRCTRSGLRPSHSKGSGGFHAAPLGYFAFSAPAGCWSLVACRWSWCPPTSHPTLTFGTQAVSTRELPLLAFLAFDKKARSSSRPRARHPYIITRPPSFLPPPPS